MKFKVGDKVRIINKERYQNYYKDFDDLEIKEVNEHDYKIYTSDKFNWWYVNEKDLELIEEPINEFKLAIKEMLLNLKHQDIKCCSKCNRDVVIPKRLEGNW